MLPLIALVLSVMASVATATAYIVSRLSSQDATMQSMKTDLHEVKSELKGYKALSERVTVLEWIVSQFHGSPKKP